MGGLLRARQPHPQRRRVTADAGSLRGVSANAYCPVAAAPSPSILPSTATAGSRVSLPGLLAGLVVLAIIFIAPALYRRRRAG